MNLKYKIIEVYPEFHSIVVRFYTDRVTEDCMASQTVDGVIVRCRTDFSIDLPLPTPVGAELEAFIVDRAPKEWLKTQEAVLDATVDTSMAAITLLLGVEVTPAVEMAKTPPTIPVVTL